MNCEYLWLAHFLLKYFFGSLSSYEKHFLKDPLIMNVTDCASSVWSFLILWWNLSEKNFFKLQSETNSLWNDIFFLFMECVNIQGYNLGQKLLRILHFLCVTECQSCRFGCAEVPLLTLGWWMLFSWGQKWSSRTSTLFFIFLGGGRGGGGVFLTAYAFKSFILIRIRHGNFCSKL